MKDFPLYRSVRSCAAGSLLLVLPLFLLSFSPLLGIYAVAAVLLLLPTAVCLAGMCCGLIPMALGVMSGMFSMYRLLGAPGLTLCAVYVLPIVGAFVFFVSQRVPFRKSCLGMIGTHLLALCAVYILLQRMAGGRLYDAAGEAAVSALKNWELGDMMLYQIYSFGLIDVKDGLQQGLYGLSDAARQDLLLSLKNLISMELKYLVPNVIVTQSILGGVLCMLLPLRFGFIAQEKRQFTSGIHEIHSSFWGRQAFSDEAPEMLTEDPAEKSADERKPEKEKVDFPDLGMPPFSLWHLPRGKGWQVGAALAAGYFLRESRTPATQVAGVILYAAAASIFIIQGAATVNFMQKARGTRRGWRVALPIILFLFSLLMLVGIFDQMSNIRGLRKPRESKEDI